MYHLLQNCYRNPIPKFPFEILLFENFNCYPKMDKKNKCQDFLSLRQGGMSALIFKKLKINRNSKILIFPLSNSKPFCPLCGPNNLPIFGNRTHKNINDRQQCVHFQKSQKVVNHSTLMHTVPNTREFLRYRWECNCY